MKYLNLLVLSYMITSSLIGQPFQANQDSVFKDRLDFGQRDIFLENEQYANQKVCYHERAEGNQANFNVNAAFDDPSSLSNDWVQPSIANKSDQCDCEEIWDIWLYSNEFYFGNTFGKGIGYQRSYGTIGVFLSPIFQNSRFQPFVDIAGHCFDNGKWAANAGMGVRYLVPKSDWVLGANLYYDYRKIHQFNRHQIAFGLELLGECLDFRFNAYFPIKDHKNSRSTLFDFSDGFFALRRERINLWTGFDAEVGLWLKRKYPCDWFGLYVAGGPYYYYENHTKHFDFSKHHEVWGGRLRVVARIWDFVDLSLIATYDPKWNTRVQGQMTIVIPFDYCGSFFKRPPTTCCRCIPAPCLQNQIASQPVQRNPIIVGESPKCCWEWNWSDDSCGCSYSEESTVSPFSRSVSSSFDFPSYQFSED